jgi:hypothetical protein
VVRAVVRLERVGLPSRDSNTGLSSGTALPWQGRQSAAVARRSVPVAVAHLEGGGPEDGLARLGLDRETAVKLGAAALLPAPQ